MNVVQEIRNQFPRPRRVNDVVLTNDSYTECETDCYCVGGAICLYAKKQMGIPPERIKDCSTRFPAGPDLREAVQYLRKAAGLPELDIGATGLVYRLIANNEWGNFDKSWCDAEKLFL